MTALITDSPALFSELSLELRLFTDERKIEAPEAIPAEGLCIVHISDESEGFYSRAVLYAEGEQRCSREVRLKKIASNALEHKKYKKRAAKQSIYDCLRAYFGVDMPWGSLTGIRPTKLFRQLSRPDAAAAREHFLDEFFVSQEKTGLCESICEVQRPIIASTSDEQIDVYIGIPFCVTRCAYCSFSSGLISKNGLAEAAYTDALLREIELVRPIFERYRVRAVYIGGGTPTSLADAELARVLEAAGRLAKGAAEFTVEAGRPDTITESKLSMIRGSGAARISVNAQSTKDETLKVIGRSHTGEEFFRAFELARGFGFDVINTDMIAGLPGESIADVEKTVKDIIALGAQNLTVHTLAIKHGSKFAEENARAFASREEAEEMVSRSRALAEAAGYSPYYLYRQKYMAGNLENVGYAKPEKACVYNVDIMEETTSILALGAGGISKRLFSEADRIERSANVKDIAYYIGRTGEMAERKLALFLDR